MSRWDAYGKLDSQVRVDGDPAFKGLDMVRDRGLLGVGTLARSENKRLRNGIAETRPGTSIPADFNPPFGNVLIGSGIYSNPNGDEVLMVAARNSDHVWALQHNKDPVKIFIDPADVTDSTGSGRVEFVQAFEKLFLLRAPVAGLNAVLVWDGNNSHKFVPITGSPPPGSALIPATENGIPFGNRLLLFNPLALSLPWRDQFIMTDVLDYQFYDPTLLGGTFRINAGASEIITALFPYDQSRLLVFMRRSIHMVSDFTINPSLTRQEVLSSRVGSEGIYSVAQLGGDVVFISQPAGIYRLTQSTSGQIAADPIPISEPIQPVIDRVAWSRAALSTGLAVLKEYLFALLPLDNPTSSQAGNAIVVHNGYTGQWESAPDWWDDPDFAIDRLHVTKFADQPRLFGVDYARSRVYLLYEGVEDETSVNDSVPVRDLIETRGYVGGEPGEFKNFQAATIGLRTLDPHARVTAITDGFNEEKEIADITKDSLQSYVHGAKQFDPLTDDPTVPFREDYADVQSDIVVESFEDLPDGPVAFLPATPLGFTGNKQQSLEPYQIRDTGRWVSIRVANVRGQCDVLGIQVGAVPTQAGVKVLV